MPWPPGPRPRRRPGRRSHRAGDGGLAARRGSGRRTTPAAARPPHWPATPPTRRSRRRRSRPPRRRCRSAPRSAPGCRDHGDGQSRVEDVAERALVGQRGIGGREGVHHGPVGVAGGRRRRHWRRHRVVGQSGHRSPSGSSAQASSKDGSAGPSLRRGSSTRAPSTSAGTPSPPGPNSSEKAAPQALRTSPRVGSEKAVTA